MAQWKHYTDPNNDSYIVCCQNMYIVRLSLMNLKIRTYVRAKVVDIISKTWEPRCTINNKQLTLILFIFWNL